MKKLLVVLTVLVLSLAVFAEVTVSGPNFTSSIKNGYVAFGLRFDENGLDIYNGTDTKVNAYYSFVASITDPTTGYSIFSVSFYHKKHLSPIFR